MAKSGIPPCTRGRVYYLEVPSPEYIVKACAHDLFAYHDTLKLLEELVCAASPITTPFLILILPDVTFDVNIKSNRIDGVLYTISSVSSLNFLS